MAINIIKILTPNRYFLIWAEASGFLLPPADNEITKQNVTKSTAITPRISNLPSINIFIYKSLLLNYPQSNR